LVRSRIDDGRELVAAFRGCEAVAHCAGINRELGAQTYQAVHIDGTRNVVEAARTAGVAKIVLLSFLRARPSCGSGYHESKYAAEEIVRASQLDYTILKAGVIYGRGDHMLDHLSHALYTLPLFAVFGLRTCLETQPDLARPGGTALVRVSKHVLRDRPIRPVAISDLVRICRASLVDHRLSRQTVAVLGPEQLLFGEAARRVARVIGRRALFVPLPVWAHTFIGWWAERLMPIPLVSLAQVRILSEGVVDPVGVSATLPDDLAPSTPFDRTAIRAGLPDPGRFGARDLRLCLSLRAAMGRR
jgi:uncharacterized protein YbjT (DUF2867 family)